MNRVLLHLCHSPITSAKHGLLSSSNPRAAIQLSKIQARRISNQVPDFKSPLLTEFIPSQAGASASCGTGVIRDLTDDGRYKKDVVQGGLKAATNMQHRGAHSGEDWRKTDGGGISLMSSTLPSFLGLEPNSFSSGIMSFDANAEHKRLCKDIVRHACDDLNATFRWQPMDVNQSEEFFGPNATSRLYERLIIDRPDELSMQAFRQLCAKLYLKIELGMHHWYLNQYPDDQQSVLTRSHLFSLDPEIVVYKSLAPGQFLNNIFPELNQLGAKAAIPHIRMSTDTPGGCIFSVQTTATGLGHNGQDNAHLARTEQIKFDPLFLSLLGQEPRFDYFSDTWKVTFDHLLHLAKGESTETFVAAIFPEDGDYPNKIGVNGPAMMYFPNPEKGTVHICSDPTGYRYASGFESQNFYIAMSEIGAAAISTPPDEFDKYTSFRIKPGSRLGVEAPKTEPLPIIPHDNDISNSTIRPFSRPTQPHIINEIAPFLDSGREFKPVPVSMGAASNQTASDFKSLTSDITFKWPQIGGPVISKGQEGGIIDTNVRIGDALYPSPFLSLNQVNTFERIFCAYDPRGTKYGLDRIDRSEALNIALKNVLLNVQKAIESGCATIALSDLAAEEHHVSIPPIILIPQVRCLILKSGNNIPIIYESQELVTPKDCMIALNIGATGLGVRGLEALAHEKGLISGNDFYKKLQECFRFYLGSSGIRRGMDFIGAKTVTFNVPIDASIFALTGIKGTKNTTNTSPITISCLTRRMINFQYHPQSVDDPYWQPLVGMRNISDVDTLTTKLLEWGKSPITGRPNLGMPTQFTQTNPLHITILGAGLAGIKQTVTITSELQELEIPHCIYLIDHQLTIAGLVSKGIHPQKQSYRKVATTQLKDILNNPNIFVMMGNTLSNVDIETLKKESYIIDARGSTHPNLLDIPGESHAFKTGVLTSARDWHESYTTDISPINRNFPIHYDYISPSIAIMGFGGVGTDIFRILTTNKTSSDAINPIFMDQLEEKRPRLIRVFLRNPDPNQVKFPESDIEKIKNHIDIENIKFIVYCPETFQEKSTTPQGQFLQHYIDQPPTQKQSSCIVELYCGYSPIQMESQDREIQIQFQPDPHWSNQETMTNTFGHAILCLGEQSRTTSFPSIGWAKQSSGIDQLFHQSQKNTQSLLSQMESGNLSSLVGKGSFLKYMYYHKTPYTNIEIERLILAQNKGIDLTDPQEFYNAVRGSKGLSEDPVTLDTETTPLSLDFPDPQEGQVVIRDYTGTDHVFPPDLAPGNIFKEFIKTKIIEQPDCGGLGTCSECSIQTQSQFPQFKQVLGSLTKDGFTLSCKTQFSANTVGILHTPKGGLQQ